MKDLLTCASGLLPVDRPDRIHGDAAEWQLFQNSAGHFSPGGPASLWVHARALRGTPGHFSILSNRRSHVIR